jgi:hypothetical protein
VFAQVANGRTAKQTLPDFFLGHFSLSLDESIYDCRHHAGRTSGWRGDHQMAAGIFFRSGQRTGGEQCNGAICLVLVVLSPFPNRRRL